MPCQHLLIGAREQVECQTGLRVLVTADDRQAELGQFEDHAPLVGFGFGVGRHRVEVVVGGPDARELARGAELFGIGRVHQPIAPGDVQVGARPPCRAVDVDLGCSVIGAVGQYQQRPRRQVKAQGAVTIEAQRILERQLLTALAADQVTHDPDFRFSDDGTSARRLTSVHQCPVANMTVALYP